MLLQVNTAPPRHSDPLHRVMTGKDPEGNASRDRRIRLHFCSVLRRLRHPYVNNVDLQILNTLGSQTRPRCDGARSNLDIASCQWCVHEHPAGFRHCTVHAIDIRFYVVVHWHGPFSISHVHVEVVNTAQMRVGSFASRTVT